VVHMMENSGCGVCDIYMWGKPAQRADTLTCISIQSSDILAEEMRSGRGHLSCGVVENDLESPARTLLNEIYIRGGGVWGGKFGLEDLSQ